MSQTKRLSFLDLPGEIRNEIYNILFAGHVRIDRNHPVRERHENRSTETHFHLESRRISTSPASVHFHVKPDLLRVCHQVHDEAVTFLYGNTTFRLESVFTMNKFLNIIPAAGAIRWLELQHSTYGEPRLTEDRKWKQRHDKKWMRTCKRIAREMKGLEHLKIELRICDWPTQLNLAANWAKPLLELKGSEGIDHVEVNLMHDAFSEQRLQATANVVARAMMSEEGRVRHELAEEVAKVERVKIRGGGDSVVFPKATKILIIRPAQTDFRRTLSKA